MRRNLDNDFDGNCEYCWCYTCKGNSYNDGKCNNCVKCSADNSNGKYKYTVNKWKMDCRREDCEEIYTE